jgi:hypothetical protein
MSASGCCCRQIGRRSLSLAACSFRFIMMALPISTLRIKSVIENHAGSRSASLITGSRLCPPAVCLTHKDNVQVVALTS